MILAPLSLGFHAMTIHKIFYVYTVSDYMKQTDKALGSGIIPTSLRHTVAKDTIDYSVEKAVKKKQYDTEIKLANKKIQELDKGVKHEQKV